MTTGPKRRGTGSHPNAGDAVHAGPDGTV